MSDVVTSPEDVNRIRQLAFESHRVDFLVVESEVARSVDEGTSSMIGHSFYQESLPYTQFLIFNTSQPPLDDSHFRRAIVAATDLSRVYDPLPINWEQRLLPAEIAPNPSDIAGISHDLEYAVEEAAASQYHSNSDDYDITYYSASYGFFDDRMAILFDTWRENLGLRVNHEHATSAFIAESIDGGKVDVRVVEASPLYPDPYAVLREFVGAFGASDEESDLAKVERSILVAASEQDKVVRAAMYEDIERTILDQALALPLLMNWGGVDVITQPWVHGLRIPKFPSSAFHGVWFDESAPERPLH